MFIPQIKHKSRLLKNKLMRKVSFAISSSQLRKFDNRSIIKSKNELRLFVMGRNESLRLPYFLEYYFNKGVDRVFFIDNNSTDNSAEIVLSYDKTHVFKTHENFKHYSNWMEILLNRYGTGHWCVAADVDEILNYPFADDISIKELSQFIEKQGDTAMQNYLLDMYSDKPIGKNNYSAGEDPLSVCSYFDANFDESNKVWINQGTQKEFNCTKFTGNMRKRVFGIDTSLSKFSLFKYGPKVFAGRGIHAMDGVRISNLRGAVFHFKYLQDFNQRVITEAARGQHEGGGREYKKYANKVSENVDLNCIYDGSIRYKNTQQLVELNIIRSSAALNKYISERKQN